MIKILNKDIKKYKITFASFPNIPVPIRDVQEKQVSGRDGILIIDKGTYRNIEITLNGHAECERSDLIDYFGFQGELTFDDSDEFFWKYRVINIDAKQILDKGQLQEFNATLKLDPFKYLIKGKEKQTAKNEITLKNKYNTIAYPYIKVVAKGDVKIYLNSRQVLEIKDVKDYVEIDCDKDMIFREYQSYDENSSGDTFFLPGNSSTTIKIEGATRFEITPNWRTI
ncbi:hypothetical protein [Helcococcus bovis]|uniref:hypothetical protein n=1 Tax=Helcococcus bovis TaxID=3153252 RepID=UPI0038B9CFF6